MKKLAVVVVAALSLSACSSMGQKQTIGAGIGGAGGGTVGWFAGNAIGGTTGGVIGAIGGTLLGAVVGGEVGASMDKTDLLERDRQRQIALETARQGQAVEWRNPATGNHGTITPTNTYQQGITYCREYLDPVVIDGKVVKAHGTACREPDGSWKVVNESR